MFRCCLQNWCRDLGLFAVPPPQRSAVAVVRDPLERFIAGYGEIEQSTSQVDDSLYSFFPEKTPLEGVKKKLVKFKLLLYHCVSLIILFIYIYFYVWLNMGLYGCQISLQESFTVHVFV